MGWELKLTRKKKEILWDEISNFSPANLFAILMYYTSVDPKVQRKE